ncbi:hypothetical protein BBJ28_00011392 [Nothophytophthora sp. Chile5]|nr:hypothetical protein BBJ28_00011392 [Nothophytophthora sp. Chile5]
MTSVTAASEPSARPLAAEQHPLLTAPQIVRRHCLPEGELSHVTRLLDAFLDEFSCKWTLVQSYEQTCSLRLMQYIAARQSSADLDPFYRLWVFNAATKLVTSRGDLPALQWLMGRYLPDAFMNEAVNSAATNGQLHVLEWLFEHHQDRGYWGCIELCGALENNHTEVVEWLLSHASPRPESVRMVLRSAVKAGNLAVVQWLCEQYAVDAKDAFLCAQSCCRWETAQWLLTNCAMPSDRVDWDVAAADGALAYLQFVHSRFPREMPQQSTPEEAAANGHLEVLRWLHSELAMALTGGVMQQAAENGHLEVVQWLHANKCERGDASTMDGAAQKGHFEVVRWLHDNRDEGCTNAAMTWAASMDSAADKGHLEVVKWLHDNRDEGCTMGAMHGAAIRGHLDVVKWLHENRSEGCCLLSMFEQLLCKRVRLSEEERLESACVTAIVGLELSVRLPCR